MTGARNRRTAALGALTALVVSTAPAAAQAPSAQEIADRASAAAYYQGRDGRARVAMTITDEQGRERIRELTILRRDEADADNGDQRFYALFDRPADVNRTALLVWKHVDGADDRWLYLPALDLVRRIAASDERSSFVGSHFFYEDVSGRGPMDDAHTLVEETGERYVIESTPRDPSGVEFTRYRASIDKTTFLPMRIDYFDGQDAVYRTYTVVAVETIQGYPTIVESRMEDRGLGGSTVLRFSDVAYDLELPEDIFTERYLRTPPRRYLR